MTTTVPKLWPESTIAILGCGPSLTREDVELVREKADAVIAINRTYELAPWANCLYGSDARRRFWTWHRGVPEFQGLKYTVETNMFGVAVLRHTGESGLETDPTGLRTGKNSAYAAINLAVHFGASRIVLLGVDMKRSRDGRKHWHPDHRDKSEPPFAQCLKLFDTLVAPLQQVGVSVINCTRDTALLSFPRMPLEDAL